MHKIEKKFIFVLLAIVLILQPASLAQAGNNWAIGNLVGLCAGTEIHVGSGDQYPVHTVVPEDNWTVKVIDGPRIVNGETWWDTSRYAAGDPSGGTGWVRQSQADACQYSGGGGSTGGGGGDTGDTEHRDGTLDRSKIADDQQPPLADYFVWPLNVGPDSSDYVKNYYGFKSPLKYKCGDSFESEGYYYPSGSAVESQNRILHPGKDMAIKDKTGAEINYEDLPKVYAVANGKVVAIRNDSEGYGDYIIIYHRFMNGDKAEYVWSVYAHLHPDSLRVTEVGQEVKAGDWIGRYDHSGNWGDAAHLHFELRKTEYPGYCHTNNTIDKNYHDPEVFIQQRLPTPGTLQEQTTMIATASAGTAPVHQQQAVIQPDQKVGPFQFAVNTIQNWMRAVYVFFFPGSTLEISVYRPDGSLYGTYLESGSFVLEIENPQAGEWRYTVQAVEIPYADYPFAVAVSLSDYNLQDTGEVLQGDPNTTGSGDTTPPVTTAILSPASPDGNQNWYRQPVRIALNTTDNAGGDVDTLYSLNDGRTYHLYMGPFTVSTEGINELSYFSVDSMGNSEDFHPLTLKIDLTPPVVTTWTDQSEYNRLQPYVVHFSGYDPTPGSGLASLNGVFDGHAVVDGQIVDLFWMSLGTYSLSVTGEDVAGWVSQESTSFELIATIESLQGTVDRLCGENYITKSGVCNALSQKLDAAQSAKLRGNMNAAVQILRAFQNAVQAQFSKSISAEATWLLMMDSSYVIQVFSPTQ